MNVKFCTQIGLLYLSCTKLHVLLQSPGIQTETGWMYRLVGGLMGTWGRVFVHTVDGWTDYWVGGYMDGQIGGWAHGWMDLFCSYSAQ